MNLIVNHISLQWQEADVRNLFTPYGNVASVLIAIDVFTERSRGFAEVEMPITEEAETAIKALHNQLIEGRHISVQQQEQKPARKGSYKVGNGAVSAYKFRK